MRILRAEPRVIAAVQDVIQIVVVQNLPDRRALDASTMIPETEPRFVPVGDRACLRVVRHDVHQLLETRMVPAPNTRVLRARMVRVRARLIARSEGVRLLARRSGVPQRHSNDDTVLGLRADVEREVRQCGAHRPFESGQVGEPVGLNGLRLRREE